MALWSVAFLGSTPVGGLLMGWVGQNVGPRWALLIGGVAAVVAGLTAYRSLARLDREKHLAEQSLAEVEETEMLSAPLEPLAAGAKAV